MAAAGEAVLSPNMATRLVAQFREKVEEPILSSRESEILQLLSGGLTNTEIGDRLYISESTVRTYIHRLLTKLNLKNRAEAIAYAALFEGMHCVTARMEVKLKRQASIGETLIATASITRKTRKLVETKAAISSKDGALVAEGTATQFVTNTIKSSKEDKAQNNG